MLWIGVDDTDSPRGGCTTHVLTEILDEAREHGLDLIGEPRLVRLNPNVPWKTRGNAALSARLGRGVGRRRRVGEVRARAVWAFERGRPPAAEVVPPFLEAAWQRVLRNAKVGETGTDPALVASDHRLPAPLYWAAVREVVPVAENRRRLDREGAWYRTHGSDRGLVGAAAAAAWPGGHPTWEAIAYRDPRRVGSPRRVEARSVQAAQRRVPSLFLCRDPRTLRLLVAPHTDCPILFGLRATDPAGAMRAVPMIRSEPVDRWLLFRTNQGTGDHLVVRAPGEVTAYRAAILEGIVRHPPTDLPGGHVRLSIADSEGTTLDCLAFEPTKTLPAVARSLRPGDRVRVWGSRARDPTFRLEGIRLLALPARTGPASSPRCPTCERRARSLGRSRGFRCPGCHRRWPPESARARTVAPTFPTGVYHPTPSARRHLAPRGPEP
jgi:tRNA(Ile2)-agmatinylcytidine synthase